MISTKLFSKAINACINRIKQLTKKEQSETADIVVEPPKTATMFTEEVSSMSREEREERFFYWLDNDYIPDRMKNFVNVELSFVDRKNVLHKLELLVFPDYLTIGTDDDHMIVPLWPLTAQRIADKWDCVLPTTKLVSKLWNAAPGKVPPQPWGPPYGAEMMSTDRINKHNKRVDETMLKLHIDRSKLVAGHKKDTVITNKLIQYYNKVAIFGWHQLNGIPIQPLYLGHINRYGDYSGGIRLISLNCTLDGQRDRLDRIMKDPILSVGVSAEGPLQLIRQPGVEKP